MADGRSIQEIQQNTIDKLKQAEADNRAAARSYQLIFVIVVGAVLFDLARKKKGK